jgi:hypothetical protein
VRQGRRQRPSRPGRGREAGLHPPQQAGRARRQRQGPLWPSDGDGPPAPPVRPGLSRGAARPRYGGCLAPHERRGNGPPADPSPLRRDESLRGPRGRGAEGRGPGQGPAGDLSGGAQDGSGPGPGPAARAQALDPEGRDPRRPEAGDPQGVRGRGLSRIPSRPRRVRRPDARGPQAGPVALSQGSGDRAPEETRRPGYAGRPRRPQENPAPERDPAGETRFSTVSYFESYVRPSPLSSGVANFFHPLASRWSSRSTRKWTVPSS